MSERLSIENRFIWAPNIRVKFSIIKTNFTFIFQCLLTETTYYDFKTVLDVK